ncbi:High affinity sulfate transporter 1 [Hibiscus syriacus]|uniref:High affinity sulfate transporter 1 n=1 Tax=Hibiscus syriacus TaxID=106335 RepID=A0A6A3BYI8_HIBSY|nr:High affinity sulfate transporter 1 [Hibiscus syriacus]
MDIRSLSSSRRQVHSESYLHKVAVPPKQNLFREFTATVKETLFADDPLRPFKHQPRSYTWRKFRGDIIAGLTIASLCIPQDIGYAKLANLDPEYGLEFLRVIFFLIHDRLQLCSSIDYAFMGSSRDIAIGPVAVVSLLLGTMLSNEIDPKKNKAEYLRLAFTATFFAGIIQATLGVLRLGFLIDFLSHAAIVGFMAGAAVTIALQQLKGLLGIKDFTKNPDIVSVMQSVWGNIDQGKKNKKFFWVPAIAPLISVIIATFFVFITRADKQGVAIVKHIKQGINPSSVNQIYFSGEYLTKGIKIGVVAGMVALTEAAAIGRTFASMKEYQIDGNKEMMAIGAMNIVGSMTSCYVATGSFSRSAVNFMAGCETAVSNIVMSSILIWKIDKFDFVACLGAFLGVVFRSVEIGLLIAVIISFAKSSYKLLGLELLFLVRSLGVLWRGIPFIPPISLMDRILRWLMDEEEQVKAAVNQQSMASMPWKNYTRVFRKEYWAGSGKSAPVVIEKLHSSKFTDIIGDDNIFLTVADAVIVFSEWGGRRSMKNEKEMVVNA